MRLILFIFCALFPLCGCFIATKQGNSEMPKPRIFRIVDINEDMRPVNSPLIINDTTDKSTKCKKCGDSSSKTTEYLVQGYDEFAEEDLSKPAFLGFDVLPLFATLENTKKVVNALSGCELAKVGYDDWNQYEIPKSETFTRKPLLGAVEITGECKGAFFKSTGKPLPVNCDECRGMYDIDENRVQPNELLLDFSRWDGTDIFEIKYGGFEIETIITEKGRKKLEDLGFDNLVYEEMFWAE